MKFSKDTLEKVLNLAHLYIDDAKKSEFLSQMQDILGHMDQLNQMDLSAVEPSAWATDDSTPRRADTHRSTTLPLQDNAPDWEDGAFSVPKILGGGD